MTRTELNTFAAQTDLQIAPFSFIDTTAMNAMVTASNAKDAAYHALQAAQNQAIADAVAAQLATDTGAQTTAIASAAAPLNAGIATLAAQLATANATIATLQTQIAGSAGAYQILVSPIDEAALQLEAAAEGISVAALIIRDSGFDAASIASKHKLTLLGTALQRYTVATDAVKLQILTMLGLQDFATASLPAQMKALQAMALDAFNALSPADENQIFVLLGIS